MVNPLRLSLILPALALLACAHGRSSATAGVADASSTPRWLTFRAPEPMPSPDSVRLVPVSGGAQLRVAVFNRRGPEPVLLLHGGMVSADIWGGEVRRLRGTHQVIVIDTRGHGRSTLGHEPLSYALLAADALTVLDSLGVPKVSVVGWSDGGITGLLLAAAHPDRVAGLLAFGANFDRAGAITETTAGDRRSDSLATVAGQQFRAWVGTEYRRLSPAPDSFPALMAALRALYAHEPAIAPATLRSIRVPTVIAAGDHEQFIRRDHTEALARLVPDSRLVILPGVGHGGPFQDPAGFHELVQEFLGRARY